MAIRYVDLLDVFHYRLIYLIHLNDKLLLRVDLVVGDVWLT